jgi:hypothetical protein
VKFYVYALIDPLSGDPFYVGKGTGKRMYQHWWRLVVHGALSKHPKLGDRLRSISEKGFNAPAYEVWFRTDDEALAYIVETQAIDFIGLENLCNVVRSSVHSLDMLRDLMKSEKYRSKMSEIRKAQGNSQKNKDAMRAATRSPEARERARLNSVWANEEKRELARANLSASIRSKYTPEERSQRMRVLAIKSTYGFHLSDEEVQGHIDRIQAAKQIQAEARIEKEKVSAERRKSREEKASRGGLKSNNKSGFTGVSWNNSKNRWRAKTPVSKIHLGYFECPVKAREVIDQWKLTTPGVTSWRKSTARSTCTRPEALAFFEGVR